jgi:hypothetical protein
MITNKVGRIWHRITVAVSAKTKIYSTLRLTAYEIEKLLEDNQYHAVINVAPFGAMVLKDVKTSVPKFVIPTDMRQLMDDMWIKCPECTYLMGSKKLVHQFKNWCKKENYNPQITSAYAQRKPDHVRCIFVNNMIINSKYFNNNIVDKNKMKLDLGLDPAKRTSIVCFGGCGDDVMLEMAKWLPAENNEYVFVSGKNHGLKSKLDAYIMENNINHIHSKGYVHNMHEYLSVSNVLLGKIGPGIFTECSQTKTNVIFSENPEDILDQEKFNASVAKKLKIGYGVEEWNYQSVNDAMNNIRNNVEYQECFDKIKVHNAAEKCSKIVIDCIKKSKLTTFAV